VHVCGKQMPSASILLLNANLLYVYDSKMYRRVCSGSVHTVGTCTRMWLCGADFRLKNVFDHKIRPKSALRSGILFTSFKFVHRPRSVSPLHFDSQNIYRIRTEKIMLALGVCFLQPCSSAGRMFAASRSHLHYYSRIVSFPKDQIR